MDSKPIKLAYLPDMYGMVTVVERADGYFSISQPRDEDDPDAVDEMDDRITFSRTTAAKLHAKLGAWLSE